MNRMNGIYDETIGLEEICTYKDCDIHLTSTIVSPSKIIYPTNPRGNPCFRNCSLHLRTRQRVITIYKLGIYVIWYKLNYMRG